MHRSQILLEKWQYEYLADESRRQGKSISELVREGLTGWIESRRTGSGERDPFFDIIGIGGGDGKTTGRDHDRNLYPVEGRVRQATLHEDHSD
jgi:hypothetical protein